MKLRFSQIYAILTAIALCYLAVTGYAAEAHTVTPAESVIGSDQACSLFAIGSDQA